MSEQQEVQREVVEAFEKNVRDIPQLLEELKALKERQKDYLVGYDSMKFDADVEADVSELLLSMTPAEGEPMSFPFLEQAVTQVVGRLEGSGLKKRLVDYLLLHHRASAVQVLNDCYEIREKAREDKSKRLKRPHRESTFLARTQDGKIRGWLSDRFLLVNHLDFLGQLVRVIVGQDGSEGAEAPHARGARCLTYHISDKRMDVCLVNPAIYVDLEKLDDGIHVTENITPEEVMRRMFRRGLANDTTDWTDTVVYPSGRMSNSETGHGGVEVHTSLCEGFCINLLEYGQNLNRRHIGKQLEIDDITSQETYKKYLEAFFSDMADVFRNTFEPERFLNQCRRFKGLQEIKINITEAVDTIVKMPGLTDELRDDILAKYGGYKARRGAAEDNLFDLNRAVTDVANGQDRDTAVALQQLGGDMLEKKEKALVLS